MTADARAEWIGAVRADTERMRACVEANDWDGLAEIERERRARLEVGLRRWPLSEDRDGAARTLLEDTLEADREIVALASAVRDELGRRLGGLAQGRRATQAYTGGGGR